MTNTELLRTKIEQSGMRKNYIAEHMGISTSTLWYKVNNKRAFNQYEIQSLSSLLNLTVAERKAIFFAV